MIKNKQNAKLYGMILGITIGIGVGLALDNLAVGAGLGVPYGVILGKILAGEEAIKDRKTRRTVSWIMIGLSASGCLLFGYVVGDIILGITSAIGFSFVVGLKWEKLYDERISNMFSKAARNAFVVVNAGLSIILIFGQGMSTEILASFTMGQQLTYIIYLSWVVFLLSWLYHANYKGE